MSKHTAGPWSIEGRIHSSGEAVRIQGMDSFGAHGYNVADVIVANGDPQNDANARLIAAAPELLEAAQNALSSLYDMEVRIDSEWGTGRSPEQIEDDGDWSDAIYALRAVIAKATGASHE